MVSVAYNLSNSTALLSEETDDSFKKTRLTDHTILWSALHVCVLISYLTCMECVTCVCFVSVPEYKEHVRKDAISLAHCLLIFQRNAVREGIKIVID